ncbi:MAG: UPF0182 family protein, partial [Gemmatimonadota bacterium]|nr:UPF0182 family protein [Gemmatimonadota bacterium]
MTPLNPVADSPFWRRGGFWILFLGALALAAILSRILVIGWTDRLWLDSLGVGSDHQSLARLRTFLWFFSWVAALVWTLGNLLVVVRSVESVHVPRRIGNLEITEILPRKYVILAMGVFGLLLATGLAAASATWWPARALIGAYQPTGLVDPVLGRDVAYYLLLLPWQRVVHGYVTILTVVILGVCIVLYAVVGAISREGWRISVGGRARRHLAALLALFACALFWGYRLELLEMVAGLKGPIAVGELESIRIPSIRLVGGVALATLLASLAWIRFRPVTIILVAWGVLGAASFVGRYLVGAAWDGAYQDAVGERAAFMEMAYGQRPIQPAERGQPAEDEGVSPGAVLWANGMATESLGRLTQDSQLVFFSGPPVSFETPAGERTWAITTVGEVDLSKRGGRAGSRWEDFHHVEHAVGGGFAVIDAAKTQPDGSPLFLIASLDRPTLGGDGAAGMHGLID